MPGPNLAGFSGVLLVVIGCQSMPTAQPASSRSYIVTTTPIDVHHWPPGLCLAVDPADPQGVWWWQPGWSGCSSRSTGPGVFRGEHATVVTGTDPASMDAGFRLPLHGQLGSTLPTFVDVRLEIRDGNMLAAATGARVATERRNNLDVPEKP